MRLLFENTTFVCKFTYRKEVYHANYASNHWWDTHNVIIYRNPDVCAKLLIKEFLRVSHCLNFYYANYSSVICNFSRFDGNLFLVLMNMISNFVTFWYDCRAVLKMEPNSSLAQLEINPLMTADEDLYKCEVTYLEAKEHCALLQSIRLNTFGKISSAVDQL